MSAADPATAIRAALDAITTPRTGKGLVRSGMIDGLTIEPDGTPVFTFLLRREDPATLVRQARQALAALGVPTPRITVTDPEGPTRPTHPPPQSAQAGVPAPTPMAVPGIARVIAISSGKGGVGKSTVSVNTAIALHRAGLRVGLMDADFYGPNIPRMMGVYERPGVDAEKRIVPLEAHGVKLMSIGFLVDRDAPAIWRGPIITKVLQQFLHDVAWGELDVLLVDMPPGTGDAQLSLVQQVMVSGAVIVTTPQEVAVGDALRGAKMFDRVNVPVLGVVENMSGFLDPHTGMRHDLFGSGGGTRLADELGVPLLGEVPLQPGLTDAADRGEPVVVAAPGSAAAVMLGEIAQRIDARVREVGIVMPTFE
ncbi:MAG: P-loop NTPase [Gemmatimonadales bacterium]